MQISWNYFSYKCILSNIHQIHTLYYTQKQIWLDSNYNFLCIHKILLVFQIYINTYNYSIFDLSYIFNL